MSLKEVLVTLKAGKLEFWKLEKNAVIIILRTKMLLSSDIVGHRVDPLCVCNLNVTGEVLVNVLRLVCSLMKLHFVHALKVPKLFGSCFQIT